MSSLEPLHALTSLRFLAAAGIVVFHYGRNVPMLSWGNPIWNIANTAVSFFFMLSGFILAYVYEPRRSTSLREFYTARFARVAPLYYVGLLICIAADLRRGELVAADAALSMLFLQSWVPGRSQVLNLPGWSLSVEVALYIAFPLILKAMLDKKSISIAMIGITCWIANTALHIIAVHGTEGLSRKDSVWVDAAFYHPIGHIGTFMAGVAGGILFRRHRTHFEQAAPLMLAAAALAPATAMAMAPDLLHRYHHNGLLAPAFYAAIVGTASLRGRAGAILGSSPIRTLGEASYGVYILQHPVHIAYVFTMTHVGAAPSPNLNFLLYATCLITASLCAYYIIEIPARRWLRTFAAPCPLRAN